MDIPPPLARQLRDALGQDTGDRLVTWLNEMRAEHDEKLAAMRVDLAESRHGIVGEIQASEARLVDRIHTVQVAVSQVDARVAAVKADLMQWSFVFWVGAVAAIAMLAGVLR